AIKKTCEWQLYIDSFKTNNNIVKLLKPIRILLVTLINTSPESLPGEEKYRKKIRENTKRRKAYSLPFASDDLPFCIISQLTKTEKDNGTELTPVNRSSRAS
ncbi:unnamed protein product, partial [Brassica oleracea]